ncbi:sulfite dehydrogenase [Guyparkeria hydrothermalis]|uniref:sulfite dehydrogenase n=1 Tax=Guyparkeria hydrothermalis TaxID=923 RepID=UPI002021F1B0|nr:sulfite dehydrogenase [Guyparkeria hydrothermalis]MCL7744443.1 sulfite dehydrogenase [Guyparkeria hydrothermalis]
MSETTLDQTPQSDAREGVASSDRRKFLRKSVALAASGAAAAAAGNAYAGDVKLETVTDPLKPGATRNILGRGVVSVPYGMPSKFEKHVVRRNVSWLTADTVASISFTPWQDLNGIITPNGLHFERHHAGAVDVDPETHRLVIHGMVDKPMIFTMEDLKRMPSHTAIHFLECPANGAMEWRGVQMDSMQFTHGMMACSEWTGVKLTDLMEYVGVDPKSTWLYAEGTDGSALQRSIPMEGAKDQFGEPLPADSCEMYKDAMIAYAQNGEALRPENGYPIRFLLPGCEANMSIKWLRRIKFVDKPLVTYQETRHYIEPLPDGTIRQFSLVNETNSVINYPCPDNQMKGKGAYEIRGIAWSGRGKIAHVDVSVDGGKNWKEAELVEPVMSKCVTKFKLPFEWNGDEHLIMSRATDETGYVQPTLMQLRNVRGTNSIYHKNSIQAWKIEKTGEVKNVQIENF